MKERTCFLLTAAGLLLTIVNMVFLLKAFSFTNSCEEQLYRNHLEAEKGIGVDDAGLAKALPASFAIALKSYPVIRQADVKRVLIVAYPPSGATFLGEVLTFVPRTFLHFEPLALFTQGGIIRPSKERYALQLLDELARCRLWKVPLYAISLGGSAGFYKHNRFLADVCEGGDSCSSPEHVSSLCLRAETQVFKIARLSVNQVDRWMRRNADIADTVRVIHLVRDPREIFAMRRDIGWCRDDESCSGAKELCSRMRADLRAFENLEKRLRPHRVHRLRLEDLASDPVNQTKSLFARLGLNLHPNALLFLRRQWSGTVADKKKRHIISGHPTIVGGSWKEKLPNNTIREVERVCGDVLAKLDYERLFPSENSAEHTYLAQIPPPPFFARR